MALFVARNVLCEHANEASVTGPRDEDLDSQNQNLNRYRVFPKGTRYPPNRHFPPALV